MDILSKLYTQSPQQAIQDIATQREKNGHCVVHFLYFANAIKQHIFSQENNYTDTLIAADFLLPDGIALQTFYAAAIKLSRVQSTRTWLANCNGTDLTLPLLNTLQKIYPGFVIHLYGGRPATAEKARVFFHDNGLMCGVVQD